jgi:chromosomal replication initiator protein
MWKTITKQLKQEIGRQSFNNWFTNVSLVKIDDSNIIIEVPDNLHKDHIINHYVDLLKKIIIKETNKNLPITFLISNKIPSTESEEKEIPIQKTKSTYFNPKFCFDNFVVGPNNSFAHAVCIAVAASPGYAYNPLFIYGQVGLGKTHLMQAIGHYIQEKQPEKSVLYISSEKFTNELISALQNQTMQQFRDKYRNIDALLIDDIQFIAGKERTQEEFFHTFNHLHNDNKQIIISSDKPPKEISKLEERLISRFEWGITSDIQPPDFETRIAILRTKAATMDTPVPDEVIEFIAANFKSNIRELEGALTKTVALSSLYKKPIDLDSTKDTLKTIIPVKETILTIEYILKIVTEHFNLTIEALKSKKRTKTLVFPRQLAMFLTRKHTDFSYPEIGEAFGGKDHSTVIHSCEKIIKQAEIDSVLNNLIEKLEKKILQ